MTVNGTLAACDWFVVKPEGCEGLTGTGAPMGGADQLGPLVPCCKVCAEASVLITPADLAPLKDAVVKSLTG